MKLVLFSLFFPLLASAQEVPSTPATPVPAVNTSVATPAYADADDYFNSAKFKYTAYGIITAKQFETFRTVSDLRPYTRRQMDLTELAFEGEFYFNKQSEVEFEIEFEHGGTGTAVEYDPFEEFGEYETEVEQGGEVAIHELYYQRAFEGLWTLKAGKFPLFISLSSVLDKPSQYVGVNASDLEINMIPVNWTETGIQLEKRLWMFTLRAGLVNGLNSEFFRKYNWVGGGYQRQFENFNADDVATIASVEYGDVAGGEGIGVSYYQGDTANNRWKKDKLDVQATVRLVSALANYRLGRFVLQTEYIVGELSNAEAIAIANTSLGGVAKPKSFAALGSKANLKSATLSYDITDDLAIYLRAEHVNTFADVEGNIFKDQRYDVDRRSGGLSWRWDRAAFLRFQYGRTSTALTGLPETYEADLALGFDLDLFNK